MFILNFLNFVKLCHFHFHFITWWAVGTELRNGHWQRAICWSLRGLHITLKEGGWRFGNCLSGIIFDSVELIDHLGEFINFFDIISRSVTIIIFYFTCTSNYLISSLLVKGLIMIVFDWLDRQNCLVDSVLLSEMRCYCLSKMAFKSLI